MRSHLGVALTLLAVCFHLSTRQALAEESGYDRVWNHQRLYEGGSDSFFQSFVLSGRFQLDYAFLEEGQRSHDEFNLRRLRLGFKTTFLNDFTLHVEGEFNPQEADPLYQRLTDAKVAWKANDATRLIVGKHSAGFTLDGLTSSKRLITIDRNNLTNNIWYSQEYIPGISVKGEVRGLIYHAGLFTSGDSNRELGAFNAGQFVLLTLGHDFADALGAQEALLRFSLVDNEPDPDNGFTRDLENIASLTWVYEVDRWGFRGDVSTATGYLGQSDISGVVLMPFLNLSDKLQLVFRYTMLDSDDVNGVRFTRYESVVEKGRGDHYDEAYLGVNYYFYGHELKWQSGVQYVEMEDRASDGGEYRGWSATTGLRLSW